MGNIHLPANISIKTIFNKIENFYSNQYGDISFKELLLHSLNKEESLYLNWFFNEFPESPTQEDLDGFGDIFNLYLHLENIEVPVSKEVAAEIYQKIEFDTAMNLLLIKGLIKIIDIPESGDWLLELTESGKEYANTHGLNEEFTS